MLVIIYVPDLLHSFLSLSHVLYIGIAIGFDPVSYSRSEGDGFVDLTFRKFSNPATLTENITVVFSTSNGTAQGLFSGCGSWHYWTIVSLLMHVLVESCSIKIDHKSMHLHERYVMCMYVYCPHCKLKQACCRTILHDQLWNKCCEFALILETHWPCNHGIEAYICTSLHTSARMHTHTHTRAHTDTHACTHTLTHSHTHTHQARRQGGFRVAWKPPTLPIA